jgi:hypothetical protein
MPEPTQVPPLPPFTIMGRSFFDPIQIRRLGVGNLLLGPVCIFGAGASGVIFGILFILFAVATWSITVFGQRPRYAVPVPARYIAGIVAAIGAICFGVFFATIQFIGPIADNL